LLIFGILFMLSFFYMTYRWGGLALPVSASEHGLEVDNLWDITMGIIVFVFVITQPVLFWFTYKYRGNKNNKATFFAHNNTLEVIWTVVPAVALTVLITYGLSIWNDIMFPENPEQSTQIEIYGKQFDWTVRYSGLDNKLGEANVRYVGGKSLTGVVSKSMSKARIADLKAELKTLQEKGLSNPNAIKVKKAKEDIADVKKKIDIIKAIELQTTVEDLAYAEDDFEATELHLVVGQPVQLTFRSQDVLHSAYLPHFRVQMNCVPGAKTFFTFTPRLTTEEMRKETGNPEFDYILLCNKICGAAHYNMQRKVIVETQEEYNEWMSKQALLSANL
ncbi:MAG: cytochrome c oxidase subunit II, partial [Flavobacteriales bacterium]